MQPITNARELRAAIVKLEMQQADEFMILKAQYQKTKESFKLSNILKSTFKETVSSPDFKADAVNAAIGFTTGVIAKKLTVGKTINPFKKLLGIVVEMAVANKVAKNADGIKSAGSALFSMLFKKREEKTIN